MHGPPLLATALSDYILASPRHFSVLLHLDKFVLCLGIMAAVLLTFYKEWDLPE